MRNLRLHFSMGVAAAAILTTAVLPRATPAQGAARLTLQDLLAAEPLGETVLSPDGHFEDADPLFSPDGVNILFLSNRDLPESTNVWLCLPPAAAPIPRPPSRHRA